MANSRNSAEKGGIPPDSFTVLLARIEDRIESLAACLKEVIAVVKTRQSERSSRCHDYEAISIKSKVSVNYDGVKGLTAKDGLMFYPYTKEIVMELLQFMAKMMVELAELVGSDQATHHQVLTQPKPSLLCISEAEKQVSYPYEGSAFWSPSYAHEDEKKWLHKWFTDLPMAVHSSYGGDYEVWTNDDEKDAIHRWKQKKKQMLVPQKTFLWAAVPVSVFIDLRTSRFTGRDVLIRTQNCGSTRAAGPDPFMCWDRGKTERKEYVLDGGKHNGNNSN